MNSPSSDPAPSLLVESADGNTLGTSGLTLARVVRLGLGILIFLVGVGLLAHWLRPELERVGGAFVRRFGIAGMALGTLIADGFHFPVPPQFYMLLAIASNTPPLSALFAIVVGSLAGGTAGFFLARRLSGLEFVARKLARSSKVVERFGSEHGYRLVVVASVTPIAYSMLCYLAGVYRLPKRLYALLALLRIPKLVFYYYLVRIGWNLG